MYNIYIYIYPVRKRCTRHRAFYMMLSLACGRIALFVWTPFVQERRHASATSVYFLCALCLYWVCLFGNLSVESIRFSQVGSCICSPGSDLS